MRFFIGSHTGPPVGGAYHGAAGARKTASFCDLGSSSSFMQVFDLFKGRFRKMSNRLKSVHHHGPGNRRIKTEYQPACRDISVTDNNDGTYSISGALHDPDKYARIDTGAIIDQRPISVIPPGNQSPPANIVINSFSVVQQNVNVQTMRVSWDQAKNAIAYEAQWRRNDGNWVNVPRSSTTSFDVPGI